MSFSLLYVAVPPHDCLPPRWGQSSYRQERHSVRGRVCPTYSMPTASSQISLRFIADWYRQGPQSMGRPPVSPTPHVPVLSAGAVRKAPNLCSGRQCCHSKKSRVGCLKDRCVSHKNCTHTELANCLRTLSVQYPVDYCY